jgi:AcrR family transcriptional regulator
MEAAGQLFVEQGYSATTMEAIATRAGVATITVYSTFGTKRALLADLISAAVAGDQAAAPIYEQETAEAVRREPDAQRQIAMFASQMWDVLGRVSPLFEAVDQAATVEPEIAKLRRRMLQGRLHGMKVFAGSLTKLRAGLSVDEAAESVWAVTAPQLHRLLVRDLGWDRERWVDWVGDALAKTLLAPAPPKRQAAGSRRQPD